jgi:CheY-like chemotaxis protein/HPt (histidine-containing phosphotransfer) domain-containing protein
MLEAAIAGKPVGEMPIRQRMDAAVARLRGKVLLVEDNEVNRRVALVVLRKLGLEVDAVVDGQEAVDYTGARDYDLVLMDMHMPRMDGLEATRAIRNAESGRIRRVPVIAMTANVVAEARSACFDAGMDDFLPKPFAHEQLVNVLRRWLPVSKMSEPEAQPAGARPVVPLVPAVRREPAEAPLDYPRLTALRDAIGDDFTDVVAVFLDSAAEIVVALNAACERGEPDAVYRHAHTLKSSAANVGAMALSALARRIELHAKAGAMPAAQSAAAELETELARVKPLLRQTAAEAQEKLRAVG